MWKWATESASKQYQHFKQLRTEIEMPKLKSAWIRQRKLKRKNKGTD